MYTKYKGYKRGKRVCEKDAAQHVSLSVKKGAASVDPYDFDFMLPGGILGTEK